MKLNFKNNLFIVVTLLLVASCSSYEDVVEEEISQAKVTIENNTVNVPENSINGNSNCNSIHLELSGNETNTFKGYRLNIHISKSGDLERVKYYEFNNPQGSIILFLTPNFNPLSKFKIENFKYDETTGRLEFDFGGTVFQDENINNNRKVSGKVKVINFKTIECSIGTASLTHSSNDLDLHAFTTVLTKFNFNTNQIHRFYLNNGYKIYMKFSSDLWDYVGTEKFFNSNSGNDNVEFYKYIGPLLADQMQEIRNSDWKFFQTSGKIIIDNKYIENGDKIISGRINLVVQENGVIIYTLIGIKFKTKSLL